jgi:hypothetical protein
MAEYEQQYAAVCGNYHVRTNTLSHPVEPGEGGVPRLCPTCSAPVFTKCRECGAPVLGRRRYIGVVAMNPPSAPWFCHECGQPYIWAHPQQIRDWVENKFKFDETLDDDDRFELLDALAVLTPGEEAAPPMDFSRFRELIEKAPTLYAQVKPFLPMFQEMFRHLR